MYLFEKRRKFVTPSFVESSRIILRIAILMNSKVTPFVQRLFLPFFEKREGKSRKDNNICCTDVDFFVSKIFFTFKI